MSMPGFTSFEEDPFFEGYKERMKTVQNFTQFESSGEPRPSASQQPASRPTQAPSKQQSSTQPTQTSSKQQPASPSTYPPSRQLVVIPMVDVFSPFRARDLFSELRGQMDTMMRGMDSLADHMMSLEPSNDGHAYKHSSVYSYDNTGEGDPQFYEAHHSERTAPGGIREERKSLRDSTKGVEKTSLGRYIGDRGLVTEKTTNPDTKEVHENQKLHGLSESELDQFKSEWGKATAAPGAVETEKRQQLMHDK